MLITNKEMEVDTKQTPVLETSQVQAKVSLPYHAEIGRKSPRWCTAWHTQLYASIQPSWSQSTVPYWDRTYEPQLVHSLTYTFQLIGDKQERVMDVRAHY